MYFQDIITFRIIGYRLTIQSESVTHSHITTKCNYNYVLDFPNHMPVIVSITSFVFTHCQYIPVITMDYYFIYYINAFAVSVKPKLHSRLFHQGIEYLVLPFNTFNDWRSNNCFELAVIEYHLSIDGNTCS